MAKWLILITGIVWLIADIYLDSKGMPTISKVVLGAMDKYGVPILAGVFFLLGHIFWPQRRRE